MSFEALAALGSLQLKEVEIQVNVQGSSSASKSEAHAKHKPRTKFKPPEKKRCALCGWTLPKDAPDWHTKCGPCNKRSKQEAMASKEAKQQERARKEKNKVSFSSAAIDAMSRASKEVEGVDFSES